MREVRWAAVGSGLAVLLTLCAACGPDGPTLAQGMQAASRARTPVAREYWNVFNSILGVIRPFSGAEADGSFHTCSPPSGQPAGKADQVSYEIANTVEARDKKLQSSPGRFESVIEQTLNSRGWGSFVTLSAVGPGSQGGEYRRGRNGPYSVYIEQHTGTLANLLELTVRGPCVTTGTALVSMGPPEPSDHYPDNQAAARPMPTEPLPTP